MGKNLIAACLLAAVTASAFSVMDFDEDFAAASATRAEVVNESAWWRLDDNSASSVVADAARAHDGVASAETSLLAGSGKIGGAFWFNNTSDGRRVDVAYSAPVFAFGDAFTVTAWVYMSGISIVPIFTQGDSWAWYVAANIGLGEAKLNFYNSYVDTPMMEQFPSDSWTFVALTHDGAGGFQMRMNEATTAWYDSAPIDTGSALLIGYDARIPGVALNGIDDVRVYNRVLSESELDFIYNDGAGTASTLP